jgi:hypothetical protein
MRVTNEYVFGLDLFYIEVNILKELYEYHRIREHQKMIR